MNQNRANQRMFRRSKSIRDILPQKPSNIAPIEPWFLLCYGCILENDIRVGHEIFEFGFNFLNRLGNEKIGYFWV